MKITHACVGCFSKTKDEAFDMFKMFKTHVQNEKENIIRCLRIDHGGEVCSKGFQNFCEMNGIKRQLTIAYTPQQNGVVERKNCIMIEMTRNML